MPLETTLQLFNRAKYSIESPAAAQSAKYSSWVLIDLVAWLIIEHCEKATSFPQELPEMKTSVGTKLGRRGLGVRPSLLPLPSAHRRIQQNVRVSALLNKISTKNSKDSVEEAIVIPLNYAQVCYPTPICILYSPSKT